MNISFYTNAECDELYNKLKASKDEAEMQEICKRLQDISWEEVPLFPTYTKISTFAYNKALTDVAVYSSGIVSFRHAKLGS